MERPESQRTSSVLSASSDATERQWEREQEHGPDRSNRSRQRSHSSTVTASDDQARAPQKNQKPTTQERLRRWWSKYGISDWRSYQQMFKASLAPTIALALYQIHAFAEYYTTLGYLVIIMAILSMANMPRAKFLQMLVVTISFALFAAALSMLAIYCCVRARDGDVAAYSSSASAIGALWLIIQIFMMSALRAKLPHLTVPCIMWAIFANTSMIYGPQFPNMAAAEAFMKQLLVAILTGYGIGAVISLLVFPLNSRQVVFGEIAAYIASLRGVLKANLDYMQSLEREDMFAATATNTLHENPPKSEEAKVLKKRINALSALHGKLSADLPFAKREIAIGKLGPDDLQDILKLLRLVVVPCSGLSCMADIFVRIAEDSGWDQNIDLHDAQPQDAHNEGEKMRIEAINEWHALMKRLRGPFEKITQTIDDGLEHVRIVLQLGGKSSKARHLEDGLDPQPGHPEFAAHFRRLSTELDGSKKIMLREWCHLHDIQLPDNFFDDGKTDFDAPQWMHEHMLAEPHRKLRRQLFMCLYMEFLLISISRRTYRLIVRVDAFREGGKLSKKRLVVPGYKRMRKWFQSLFTDTHDVHGENEEGLDSKVYLGDAYKRRKDPEHLPPANAWEKFGEQLRKIPHFFQSPAAAFGLRASAATMSIAIVGFLHDTQKFHTQQRIFWAQIMVCISSSPTAGQSLQGFFFRAFGTVLACLTSLMAWYFAGQNTAGIICFFFGAMHVGIYIMMKWPQYLQVGIIYQITVALIIGYELQVRELGVVRTSTNGQAYYPIYELGPIRIATVAGGLFVGWIWTWFPYPITEHSQLRKHMGSAFYLLANYYSVTHETVRLQLSNEQGDVNEKNSPAQRLDKARNTLYAKANLTIGSLLNQAAFIKYDIPIGGRFPRQQYQLLINQTHNILNFLSLVQLASYTFAELREEGPEEHGLQWLYSLQKLVAETSFTSQQVTTLLTLLSASITSERPLPPYLRVPEPHMLSQRLDEMDRKILSVRHIAEPGYASFAVIQISMHFMLQDLRRMVAGVKELVGELDFSYHIVSTADATRNDSHPSELGYTTSQNSRPKDD